MFVDPSDLNWQKELLDRLDLVAAKIGQGAGYLWHVLVKQGIAEGVTDATCATMSLLIAVMAGYYARKFGRLAEADNWHEPGYPLGFIASLGIAIVAGLCVCAYTHDAVLELVNPEYFALHEILKTIGK